MILFLKKPSESQMRAKQTNLRSMLS